MAMQKYLGDIVIFLDKVGVTDSQFAQKSGKIYASGYYQGEEINLAFGNFKIKTDKPEIEKAWFEYLSSSRQIAKDYHAYLSAKTSKLLADVSDLLNEVDTLTNK